jgi:hypothetical protein
VPRFFHCRQAQLDTVSGAFAVGQFGLLALPRAFDLSYWGTYGPAETPLIGPESLSAHDSGKWQAVFEKIMRAQYVRYGSASV